MDACLSPRSTYSVQFSSFTSCPTRCHDSVTVWQNDLLVLLCDNSTFGLVKGYIQRTYIFEKNVERTPRASYSGRRTCRRWRSAQSSIGLSASFCPCSCASCAAQPSWRKRYTRRSWWILCPKLDIVIHGGTQEMDKNKQEKGTHRRELRGHLSIILGPKGTKCAARNPNKKAGWKNCVINRDNIGVHTPFDLNKHGSKKHWNETQRFWVWETALKPSPGSEPAKQLISRMFAHSRNKLRRWANQLWDFSAFKHLPCAAA